MSSLMTWSVQRLQISTPGVIQHRIGHVTELLSNIQGTGDSTADEHVGAARDLANTILECNIE
jgi:hypothetical protein